MTATTSISTAGIAYGPVRHAAAVKQGPNAIVPSSAPSTPWTVPRTPVMVPSAFAAYSTSIFCSRACTVAAKLSTRSSISFTGRPVRCESRAASTSSP